MIIILCLKYCTAVFMVGIGVFQLAAMRNRLGGLLFFKNRWYTLIFASLTLIPSLYYFFTWNYRNETGIIEGNQQAGLFVLTMSVALLFTLCLSSLINRSRFKTFAPGTSGIEVLGTETFLHAIGRLKRVNSNE